MDFSYYDYIAESEKYYLPTKAKGYEYKCSNKDWVMSANQHWRMCMPPKYDLENKGGRYT